MLPTGNPRAILECLARHRVEFIVIGGAAGALQGAPIVTWDLDIVHRRTPENIERLVRALTELDAYYREHEDRRPRPDARLLLGPGHHLLATNAGPLDVLGTVTGERDYSALLPHADLLDLGEGLQLRVASLEMLIRLKEELGRERDRAALPVLRATLAERRRPPDE